MTESNPPAPSAIALLPLLAFLALYFGTGLTLALEGVENPFYQLNAPVAALPAIALALWYAHRRGVPGLDTLLAGMGERNVMLMCLIFVLAGAFSEVGKATGAVDAVVALGVGLVPAALLVPGLFVVAAFISLSIGTSMGTLAAVAPIALGIAEAAGLDRVLVLGAVIGGAMFGDNLSVISDTTIAATRTQGAEMRDKFRENLKFAAPAALATVVLLAVIGGAGDGGTVDTPAASAWLVLPYVIVLGLALAGVDVVVTLGIGIVLAAVFGAWHVDDYGALRAAGDVWRGIDSMLEITVMSLFIGGLAALVRATGGLAWLAAAITRLTRADRDARQGQIGIAALSVATDAFTANNTVAILVAGPVARELAERNGVSPRRAASVLDIFACVTQGLIPYGAQILLAGSLGAVSPLALVGAIHYCWFLGIAAAAGILFWPRARGAIVRPTVAAPPALAQAAGERP